VTVERKALAERVRAALPRDRPVRAVSMFGGLSFMVDGGLVVSAGRTGDLLVRVDPGRRDELLTVSGAGPAVMGDRPMGPGWIRVDPAGLATDERVAFWVGVGLEHLRSGGRAGTPGRSSG
jgi:hypothetical protein